MEVTISVAPGTNNSWFAWSNAGEEKRQLDGMASSRRTKPQEYNAFCETSSDTQQPDAE